jgi:hypothetical protein
VDARVLNRVVGRWWLLFLAFCFYRKLVVQFSLSEFGLSVYSRWPCRTADLAHRRMRSEPRRQDNLSQNVHSNSSVIFLLHRRFRSSSGLPSRTACSQTARVASASSSNGTSIDVDSDKMHSSDSNSSGL